MKSSDDGRFEFSGVAWKWSGIQFIGFKQPKCNICPMLEADMKPTLHFDVNLIFIPKKIQRWLNSDVYPTPMLEVDVNPIFNQNVMSFQC